MGEVRVGHRDDFCAGDRHRVLRSEPQDGEGHDEPVVAGHELYIGSDDGAVVAVHEANPRVPKLAVYYDSTRSGYPFVAGGRFTFEYFRGLGYQALDADSVAAFMSARITDATPSVVVFATDVLPRTIAPAAHRSPSSAS